MTPVKTAQAQPKDRSKVLKAGIIAVGAIVGSLLVTTAIAALKD